MILTCPECATRYFVNETAVSGDGRMVRCAACRHVWRAELEAPAAPPMVDTLVDAPEDVDPLAIADPATRQAAPEPPEPRRRAAFAAAAAAVAAVAVGAWAFRMPVVSVWPQAASLYALFGAEATASGLAFEAVEASRAPDSDVLQVRAQVRNLTGVARPAPLVRVMVRDDDGALVLEAFAALEDDAVAAHGLAPLAVDLPGAPPGANAVELTFEPQAGPSAAARP